MSFRQPFRAVPIKEGARHRQKRQRQRGAGIAAYLGGAALLGAVIGIGSVTVRERDVSSLAGAMKGFAVSAGVARARAPQPGDYWPGCDAARAAGTAPIYRGEPGYREGMDGDSDGIACEPYR